MEITRHMAVMMVSAHYLRVYIEATGCSFDEACAFRMACAKGKEERFRQSWHTLCREATWPLFEELVQALKWPDKTPEFEKFLTSG